MPELTTPVPVNSVTIGTFVDDGPAVVTAAVASAGGLERPTLMTHEGYTVVPGVYLHRDSVVALLKGYAEQQHDPKACEVLEIMANHMSTRG